MQKLYSAISNRTALLSVLALALVLRLPLLTGSFWLDEAAQALESSRPLSQQLELVPDFQPPLLHLILHFALYLDDTEWWLRSVGALLPGIVTIGVTFLIAQRLTTKRTALLVGLLLATSSLHIFYSQELRPYSLPAMWAVLSWWWIIRFIKHPKLPADWVGWFTLFSLGGLYSSYLYPFVLLGQFAFSWFAQKSWRSQLLLSGLLLVLGFLPWLPMFSRQLAAGGMVRVVLPGWSEVVSLTQLRALPIVIGAFVFGQQPLDFNLLTIGTISLLAALLMLTLKNRTAWRNQKFWLLCSWLILPIGLAWLISFKIPVIQPKRVLFALPAFYLFLMYIAHYQTIKLPKIGTLRLDLLVWLLLITINFVGLLNYWRNPLMQRENWRRLHSEIGAMYAPTDTIVVFGFDEPFAPWRWYDLETYDTLSLGQLHVDQLDSLRDTLEPASQYPTVLVFDYLRDLSDPDDRILSELRKFGYTEIGAFDGQKVGFVRIYVRKTTLLSQIRQGLP